MPLEETRLSHFADFAFCQPSDSGMQYPQSENLKAVVIYTAVFFKTGLNIPVAAETTTVGDEGALAYCQSLGQQAYQQPPKRELHQCLPKVPPCTCA